jgi:hypothetical protein
MGDMQLDPQEILKRGRQDEAGHDAATSFRRLSAQLAQLVQRTPESARTEPVPESAASGFPGGLDGLVKMLENVARRLDESRDGPPGAPS